MIYKENTIVKKIIITSEIFRMTKEDRFRHQSAPKKLLVSTNPEISQLIQFKKPNQA